MQNIPSLKEKVRRLPKTSGVYVMKDALGNVIYIGKAVNLRRRVGQYFMNSYKARAASPKIASLVDCIADFEFFNTRGDAEAVILESKLIKRWKPATTRSKRTTKTFSFCASRRLRRFRDSRSRATERTTARSTSARISASPR